MEEGRDALFPLGRIVATPGALAALEVSEEGAGPFLARHVTGDWGELDPEDRQANELAVEHGSRIMSVYRTAGGVKFWIMTEADRSSTCFLLPEEY
jgi:glycine cleavage system aminomethyltransferase T